MPARVVRISVAPVKSLGLVHPDDVELGVGGVRGDRMLFEIDGIPPHEEDTWIGSTVAIGDAELVVNGDVGRCIVTSLDPDRGVSDLDTLGTLARYRREGRVEPLPFDVYGTVTLLGRVRVGDAVQPRG